MSSPTLSVERGDSLAYHAEIIYLQELDESTSLCYTAQLSTTGIALVFTQPKKVKGREKDILFITQKGK